MKNFAVVQHLSNVTLLIAEVETFSEAAEIIRDLRDTMAYLEIIRL